MLTYETLRKIANAERSETGMVRLPDNFFREVNAYITKKSQAKADGNWELEAVIQTLNEILERRERKMVNFAIDSVRSGDTPANLTDIEAETFNKVVAILSDFKLNMKQLIEHAEVEIIVVAKDLDSFVGTDLKTYGPLKAGDIVMLPKDVAKLLLEKEYAQKMKV